MRPLLSPLADAWPELNARRAAAVLRNETAVDAVELFDRASLRECEADENMTRLVRTVLCDRAYSISAHPARRL